MWIWTAIINSYIFYQNNLALHFPSILYCAMLVSVLQTLVRNRTIHPAEPAAKELPGPSVCTQLHAPVSCLHFVFPIFFSRISFYIANFSLHLHVQNEPHVDWPVSAHVFYSLALHFSGGYNWLIHLTSVSATVCSTSGVTGLQRMTSSGHQ